MSFMLDELLTEMKLRNMSERTISAYMRHNRKFLEYAGKSAGSVSEKEVRAYMAHLIADRKLSPRTVALVKAALKFQYDEILGRGIVSLKTPKTQRHLPTVLSRAEVRRLIESPSSPKSRLILMVLYSSGIRLSECINLRVSDLELEERIGWVRRGKGGKDRVFILSESLVKSIGERAEAATSSPTREARPCHQETCRR